MFGILDLARDKTFKEIDQVIGVLPVLEEEVHTVVFLLHFHTLLVRIVLQDHLFEIEECLFVGDMLSELDHCAPCVGGELFLAILALLPMFGVFNDKTFLNFDVFRNFFLNSQFNLNSS